MCCLLWRLGGGSGAGRSVGTPKRGTVSWDTGGANGAASPGHQERPCLARGVSFPPPLSADLFGFPLPSCFKPLGNETLRAGGSTDASEPAEIADFSLCELTTELAGADATVCRRGAGARTLLPETWLGSLHGVVDSIDVLTGLKTRPV